METGPAAFQAAAVGGEAAPEWSSTGQQQQQQQQKPKHCLLPMLAECALWHLLQLYSLLALKTTCLAQLSNLSALPRKRVAAFDD